MSDIGNPFGVDLATTTFGAGLSLVISAGAMMYGYRLPEWTSAELIGMAGAGLVVIGTLFGLVMVLSGLR